MDSPGVYEWRSMTAMRKWEFGGWGERGIGRTGWMYSGLLEEHSMNYDIKMWYILLRMFWRSWLASSSKVR